ncbi:DsbA family protein [Sphingobium sufflavum]|uniref:DsbA family protein n=1 Tax=Sphingobium sufflavum TaxID=1129547 RepID=UPI001F26E7C5|nr:thioredoxin domain-containing protein [Sphingobium sufflavum]MCE7795320.1 DsbA family protein [Sphingobium sufflavum]
MRALPILLAALFAIPLASPGLAKAPVTAPAKAPANAARPAPTDWTRTVTLTPDGAFVLGNPRATRMVEYVSYTCSHCAHFVGEASAPLRADWVRRGALSIEVRNAIRDPYDLTAAVLARCGGPARFFGDHEALFANQTDWMPRIEPYEQKRADQPPIKDPGQQLAAIAEGTGLSSFMARRGLPLARQRACFADKATLTTLAAMAKDAWEVKQIGGTPSFSVGGTMVAEVHDWNGLRGALPAPRK